MTTSTPTQFTPSQVSAAYQAAAERESARLRDGAVLVGYKVGFTNTAVWEQMGINAPMWGVMYQDTVIDAVGAPFRYSLATLQGPRIEPEIIVHLNKTPEPDATPESLLECIDWVAAGYELVLTPADGKRADAMQSIALGGMHGVVLLGERRTPAELGDDLLERLADTDAKLYCNGELKEAGSSAKVLGHPLNAVQHLMQALSQQGRAPLQAGDIISTGTMTAAYPAAPGERWSLTLEGLDLPGLDVIFE